MVARGEIWWHEHPTRGSRPHLILSRDEAIGVLSSVLAVPLTRSIRGIPSEVVLDGSDGVREECVLSMDNTTLVKKALFTRKMASLGPERMAAVCAALKFVTGC